MFILVSCAGPRLPQFHTGCEVSPRSTKWLALHPARGVKRAIWCERTTSSRWVPKKQTNFLVRLRVFKNALWRN